VGNIGVVDFEYDSVLQNSYTIVIDMPITTRLPVSRDDILFDSQFTVDVFKMNLDNLREKWAFNKLNDFTVLEDGLKIYSNYTTQNIAKTIVTDFINSAQEYAHKLTKFFVFVKYKSVFDELNTLKNTKSYISAHNSSGQLLEKYMEKKYEWNKKIYVGKSVMFIKLENKFNNITNAGTTNYIIIDEIYKNNNQNWLIDLLTIYIEDQLYPFEKKYVHEEIDKYKSIINEIKTNNLTVKNQIFQLLLKIKSLSTFFKVGYVVDDKVLYDDDVRYNDDKHLIKSLNIALIIGDENVINYINKLIMTLSDIKPSSFTYGNKQPSLVIGTLFGTEGMVYDIEEEIYDPEPFVDLIKMIKYKTTMNTFISFLLFSSYMNYIDDPIKLWNFNFFKFNSNEQNKIIEFSIEFQNIKLSLLKIWENYQSTRVNLNIYDYHLNPLNIILNYYNIIKLEHQYESLDNYDMFKDIPQNLQNPEHFMKNIATNEKRFNKLKLDVIIKILTQKSNNVLEWISIFLSIALNYYKLDKLKNIDNNDISNIIQNAIIFLRSNLSVGDIKYTFIHLTTYHNVEPFNAICGDKITEYIIQYINYIDKFKNMEIKDLPVIQNYYSFTGTNLVSYFFNKDINKEDLLTYLPDINNYKPTEKFPLQSLEIAINEGTNKPFIEAILTETVQNSLDAIRTENPNDKNININIYKNKNNDNSIIVSIEDNVGIPNAGLLSLKIPFLSSKTPSEIVTGEMGSGFFNVYRESNKVIIDTERDGRRVLIEDTPIKVDNRVIDVNTKISYQKTDRVGLGYTKIMIEIIYNDINKMVAEISNIYFFIKNIIGLINVDNIDIKLNNESIKIQLEKLLVNDNKNFEAFISNNNQTFSSYIMTKGIPFNDMYSYFYNKNLISNVIFEELKTNISFNIKHGVYTPVQSRTQLNINENALRSLKKFIADLAYIYILSKIRSDIEYEKVNASKYLPNVLSTQSVNQLLFGNPLEYVDITDKKLNISNFIIRYQYKYDNKDKEEYSLGSIINKAALIMGSNSFSNAKSEIIREINKYPKILQEIVLGWLQNKNTEIPEFEEQIDFKDIYSSYDKYIDFNIVNNIDKFSKIFVRNFWVLGYLIQEEGNLYGTQFTETPPIITWTFSKDLLSGFYIPNNHEIILNIFALFNESYKILNEIPSNYNKVVEMQEKIKIFNEDDRLFLKNYEIYNEWFGIREPSSVLVHELEHAWRRNIHTMEGAHDTIKLGIGPNASKNIKVYEFDIAANEIYKYLITQNLLGYIKNDIDKTIWN
jgi:hypothetical protein